ncbi:MAG: hypothetical protein A2045_15460 [Rhodocyclales bacterium GWA2_65_20]|nr:MAG: hypothetical protein A2045_15460 [Rhodocyclales bacterium GWA2_65_20]
MPWKWIAVAAALAAAMPACAQQPAQRQMPPWQGRGDNERPFPPQRQDQSSPDMQRQGLQHHGRMSPEERRQLRHDINEAGRELYRRNPQRPPP